MTKKTTKTSSRTASVLIPWSPPPSPSTTCSNSSTASSPSPLTILHFPIPSLTTPFLRRTLSRSSSAEAAAPASSAACTRSRAPSPAGQPGGEASPAARGSDWPLPPIDRRHELASLAAAECGLRRWELSDLHAAAGEDDDHEDAVPFKESVGTAAALCLAADEGARVVWSGHRDGRIRCWRMDENDDGFKEGLSWKAHRSPVLSLVITAYGDLWSGSEAGVIKIWPSEAIERSLSLTTEERPMAAILGERSFIDPRSQAAVNGYSNTLNSDVKYLLSDNTRAKVWSAGYLSFALKSNIPWIQI